MIRFLLNAQPMVVDDIEPSMTILRFLRTRVGQKGTKEGCASGDCGACTVVVAHWQEERWHYRSVNSCVTLLASVHGKHLITVEGLAEQHGQRLHPVQQALVEYHGSQCGFCTPGFVMSLMAAYENNPDKILTEPTILEALSGNLCRCTGYRPIVDAALNCQHFEKNNALFYEVNSDDLALQPLDDSASNKLAQPLPIQLEKGHGVCLMPTSEKQLIEAMANYPNAQLVAGGTDLLLEQTQHFDLLPQLIGVSEVLELKKRVVEHRRVSVGGAVTLTQLEETVADECPEFFTLLQRLGSRQIRNQGTLAGNIANASPVADTPPLLMALDGTLELASSAGTRHLPLPEFFIAYKKTQLKRGEYIRQILFELPGPADFLRAYKISKRYEDDISTVLLVVRWRIDNGIFRGVRLAAGGVAATPLRLTKIEQLLEGESAGEPSIARAQAALQQVLQPLSDVRGSAAYRLRVTANLLTKAWLESQQKTQALSVWSELIPRVTGQTYRGAE